MLLNLSAQELADRAGLGVATVRRMELAEGIPSSNAQNLGLVKSFLEDSGIEFVGTQDDRPGVRLGRPSQSND